MWKYIAQRLGASVFGVWAVITLVFLFVAIVPGDSSQAGLEQANLSESALAERASRLGLNRPLSVQYATYLQHLVSGDLGMSRVYDQPVRLLLYQNIGPTLSLMSIGIISAVGVGGTIGLLAGLHRNRYVRVVLNLVIVCLIGTPAMITGVVLILVFGIGLAWFPSSGHGEVRHLLLPGFSLGFAAAGGIARAMRTGVVEAEQMPHVLAARARGINGNRLTVAHILRVGLSPTVQVVALQVGYLTGGVVVTETLFVRPGLGRLLTSAVLDKDLPVVLGGVLVVVIGYVFANLTSDIFSALLDPRIQYES